eukprot:8622489-Pyramimonas_sp.AAC.1
MDGLPSAGGGHVSRNVISGGGEDQPRATSFAAPNRPFLPIYPTRPPREEEEDDDEEQEQEEGENEKEEDEN